MADPGAESVERLQPTAGRFTGFASLLAIAAFILMGVVYDERVGVADWLYATLVLVAVLVWAAMLRPRVSLTDDDLVLRNMMETVRLPLAALEDVTVRQVLAVWAGGRRYVSPAIGRSRRTISRDEVISRSREGAPLPRRLQDAEASYGDFVEERIRTRAENAREQRGIRPRSAEQAALADDVRRQPAWPEIVALAVAAIALVVTIVL